MKKASHILGLIGGILALVAAGACIIVGLLIAVLAPGLAGLISGFVHGPEIQLPSLFGLFSQIGGIAIIIVGLVSTAIGVLALVGAKNVDTNSTKAGVLMLVAGGLALFTSIGWPITVLCVLGGIFALVKEKTPDCAPPPPQG
jgi:hypothetical protein